MTSKVWDEIIYLFLDFQQLHYWNLGINPLRAKFFQREHKYIFTFYNIPPH